MKLLLIDDHNLFRGGLIAMLRHRFGDSVLIQEAASFGDALEQLATESAFDVVLCDIDMPDMGPDRHIGAVVAAAGSSPVVVVTASTFPAVDQSARALGAQGFVSKSRSFDDVVSAIETVANGENYFPKEEADTAPQAEALAKRGAKAGLTPKETIVLMSLAQGLSNKAIARNQGVSENAIKIHVRNVFSKLGVNNRTQAAMHASKIFFGSESKHPTNPS